MPELWWPRLAKADQDGQIGRMVRFGPSRPKFVPNRPSCSKHAKVSSNRPNVGQHGYRWSRLGLFSLRGGTSRHLVGLCPATSELAEFTGGNFPGCVPSNLSVTLGNTVIPDITALKVVQMLANIGHNLASIGQLWPKLTGMWPNSAGMWATVQHLIGNCSANSELPGSPRVTFRDLWQAQFRQLSGFVILVVDCDNGAFTTRLYMCGSRGLTRPAMLSPGKRRAEARRKTARRIQVADEQEKYRNVSEARCRMCGSSWRGQARNTEKP